MSNSPNKSAELMAETDRLRSLLMDTVVLLCKNGLRFEKELKVQGLIGITVDTDVFLVQFNEQFGDCNDEFVIKEESSSLNHDKSVTPFSQSDQVDTMQHVQRHTTAGTFQQSYQCDDDCDQAESFSGAVKEEAVDYDDTDSRIPSKEDNRYCHSETVLLGSMQEDVFQRPLPHWSFLSHSSNTDDAEVNDVIDDGLFMSGYTNSSASYTQQQLRRQLDEQAQNAMESNLVHWTDTSQFSTCDRFSNGPSSGRSLPVIRKRKIITRGRGRVRNAWISDSKPGHEWLGASEYTLPSVPERTKPRAKVETQAADGFSYAKLTVSKYVCNICGASYKHQCNLLTHQVRVHGRQKKKTGRRPKKPDLDDNVLGSMKSAFA